jgi:predicted cobalt transporter CbtA
MVKGQIPTGVKAISILFYIEAVMFGIIMGLISFFTFLIIRKPLVTNIPELPDIPALDTFSQVIIILTGIFFIGLGILYFFIGRGLWKGHKWARITAIIFTSLGILLAVISVVTSSVQGIVNTGYFIIDIIEMIVKLVVVGYLIFSSKVKAVFS